MNIIHIGTHVRIVVNYLAIIVIVYVMTGTVSIANNQEKKKPYLEGLPVYNY